MEQVHLKITGAVQGVFFRAESSEKARAFGLTGWVKNTRNGDVEIIAQGERARLEEFIQWCRSGPQPSKVERVEIVWENPQEEFSTFEIRYD